MERVKETTISRTSSQFTQAFGSLVTDVCYFMMMATHAQYMCKQYMFTRKVCEFPPLFQCNHKNIEIIIHIKRIYLCKKSYFLKRLDLYRQGLILFGKSAKNFLKES